MIAPESTVCRFYQLIPDAPPPRRADRSADGMLAVRAYRYCEAQAAASSFGFYLYPPVDFSLLLDRNVLYVSFDGDHDWSKLHGARVPGFQQFFKSVAPLSVRSLEPTFLAASREPGVVQIWSGYLARTAPDWSLLSRGVANVPITEDYECFDGIVETDNWLGPLFTNIRLTRTNSPVRFSVRYPLFQVQPVPRECYQDPPFEVLSVDALSGEDWGRYELAMRRNKDRARRPGKYAVEVRKRQHEEAA